MQVVPGFQTQTVNTAPKSANKPRLLVRILFLYILFSIIYCII